MRSKRKAVCAYPPRALIIPTMAGYFKTSPPSRHDYKLWLSMGYRGSYDEYTETKERLGQTVVHVSGEIEVVQCRDCLCLADEYLCDYPVGDGITCDAQLCDQHAHEVAEDTHYCKAHYQQFQEFKNNNGVAKILGVIAPVINSNSVATNEPNH